MNRKAMHGWFIGIPVLVLVLIGIIVWKQPQEEGVSRASACRAVSLALNSEEEFREWQKSGRTSHFPAKEQDNWFVPYMDYLYDAGYLDEGSIKAAQEEAVQTITYGELGHLLDQISDSTDSFFRVTKKNRNETYPKNQFAELYERIAEKLSPDGEVKKQTLLLFGTPRNAENGMPWTAYTNLGEFRFDGLALDSYVDREIEVFTRDSELIWMNQVVSDYVIYKNAWIMEGSRDDLLVFLGTMKREMPYDSFFGKESVYNQVADLTLKAGKLEKISVKKARISTKVLSVHDTYLELEGYGSLELDEGFRVLKTYGTFEEQTLKDILVGYDLQEFVIAGGKICAALTVREFDAARIRVLLMTTEFLDTLHPAVSLVCEESMTLTTGKESRTVPAGEIVEITSDSEELAKGRMIFDSEGNAGIQILSIERSGYNPIYEGQIEVVAAEDGIALVNDVYLEDYLKKVVPSEMPASYKQEALKAQVVCARTYAYMQIRENRYLGYGAHVDDSTSFQVYNNTEGDYRTDAAVQETYGELLTHEGTPITAFYFSTSCGVTADGSIWGVDSTAYPYLKSVCLQGSRSSPDLTDNDDFAKLIKNQDYPSYDSAYDFYRWHTTTTSTCLRDKVEGIGDIESVEVTERGSGGFVNKLEIVGSQGSKTIVGQSNVRAVLGNADTAIVKRNGGETTGWSSLPSAFLTVEAGEKDADGVTIFNIYGGGYGHGAGMSQNGAQGMALQGKDYIEILQFFYENVEIEKKNENS